uniref:Uncharacterized protein n=1 Tax=Anguilla anguilla TaxID=7936 RepID=A0A0E9P8T2_ANGAN
MYFKTSCPYIQYTKEVPSKKRKKNHHTAGGCSCQNNHLSPYC